MNNIKSNKACASCKLQRRRCLKDCLLAPHFPADKPITFANAHRLYGVSNMVRILENIPEEMRQIAMRTIIYESNVRLMFPVHGCLGVIKECCDMISEAFKELCQVKELLHYCKVNHLQQLNLSSLLPSTSSQNPNLQPHVPMDCPLRASTNSHVSNIPIFNNVGNVSDYWNDIIPSDVNNIPTNTNLNINSNEAIRVAQLNEELSDNKESDLHGGGVDTNTSVKVDLEEKETPFNVDDFFIPDSDIDKFY
ncbi:unnamed protein product [Lathyrus oleraceus]